MKRHEGDILTRYMEGNGNFQSTEENATTENIDSAGIIGLTPPPPPNTHIVKISSTVRSSPVRVVGIESPLATLGVSASL